MGMRHHQKTSESTKSTKSAAAAAPISQRRREVG
ncbi:hypothetical protein PSYPI_09610 [Pseudomonas syringae pv. pisi str. 1704B]|uniref:Uncharacterized protein n=1 Tax=Pseudomonas syringae pv. pisi str. 1704B TaxID=629263 RepID=F3G6D5_PSESJ|nr:hypothetical protein PSYPI_09610 [Pseudomonas syringae pv. pisi str. 1704B]